MKNNIVIRELRPDEIAPLELLLLADPCEEMIKQYLESGYCYIAVTTDGQVAGVYVLLPTAADTVELVNVAVAENMQGKGIGKLLVGHALAIARLRGFESIVIGTGNSSINQLALYQKCGFRITGIDKDYFVRNYPQAIFENGIQCRDMIRLAQKLVLQKA